MAGERPGGRLTNKRKHAGPETRSPAAARTSREYSKQQCSTLCPALQTSRGSLLSSQFRFGLSSAAVKNRLLQHLEAPASCATRGVTSRSTWRAQSATAPTGCPEALGPFVSVAAYHDCRGSEISHLSGFACTLEALLGRDKKADRTPLECGRLPCPEPGVRRSDGRRIPGCSSVCDQLRRNPETTP